MKVINSNQAIFNDSKLLSPENQHFIHNHALAEEKLNNALSLLNVGIWEYDALLNKIQFTRSYAALIGVEYDKLKDIDLVSFLSSYIHADDLKPAVEMLAKLNTKSDARLELTLRIKNGEDSYKYINHIIKLSDKNDKGFGTYYRGVARDISDLESQKNNTIDLQAQLNNYNIKYSERVKEQELLYSVFDIFNKNRNINSVLGLIAKQIPYGSQLNNQIAARINYGENVYMSVNFKETSTFLKSEFKSLSGIKGNIEVFYSLNPDQKNIGPAFNEAVNLINALSIMLKAWIDKRETEKELENMLVELEYKIEDRTNELKTAHKKLSDAYKDISDSILYAKNIQTAILPSNENFDKFFKESLLFYKPKDVVSGDFYWTHKKDNKIFLVSADCTGHGVPGALMSMVGIQLLNFIITDKNILDPGTILQEIDTSIKNIFHQNDSKMRDGMAISLCVIDTDNNSITFSGAQNNAYILRDGKVIVLEANRYSIGGGEFESKKTFTNHILTLQENDSIFMFSDGLPDQFGGEKGKKLMKKNLLEFLLSIQNTNMENQNKAIEKFYTNWKGDNFQVDDITVIGVKL